MTKAANIIRKYHVTLVTFALVTLIITAIIYAGVGAIPLALASFLAGFVVAWVLWAERLVNRMDRESRDYFLRRGLGDEC